MVTLTPVLYFINCEGMKGKAKLSRVWIQKHRERWEEIAVGILCNNSMIPAVEPLDSDNGIRRVLDGWIDGREG